MAKNQARLLQGNEAVVEGAIAAGLRFSQVTPLLRLQRLLSTARPNSRLQVASSYRWKMKLPVWQQSAVLHWPV